MKRLFLTFPHGHLSTVSHSNPTHLQDEPGSSFSASNTAPSCQVKGGRVTFLPPHSIPKTTGLAALAQPSLTPSGNYTQGFSHLYTKSYKLLCISPSYDTPNQVLQQLMLFRISRFSLWHCSNGTFNLESQHKFHQHKPFVALLSSMLNFLLHRNGHSMAGEASIEQRTKNTSQYSQSSQRRETVGLKMGTHERLGAFSK